MNRPPPLLFLSSLSDTTTQHSRSLLNISHNEKKRKLEDLKKAKEEKAVRDAEEREAQIEIGQMEKVIGDLTKEFDKKLANVMTQERVANKSECLIRP